MNADNVTHYWHTLCQNKVEKILARGGKKPGLEGKNTLARVAQLLETLILNQTPIFMIQLLPGEVIITETARKKITLTNFRVCHIQNRNIESILLTQISCIKTQHHQFISFMVLGFLSIAGGLLMATQVRNEEEIIGAGVAIGAFFILIFFLTRYRVVAIYAASGQSIQFTTRGFKNENLITFINKVDEYAIQSQKILKES